MHGEELTTTRSFVGVVDDDGRRARPLCGGDPERLRDGATAGEVALFRRDGSAARRVELLARPDSARASLYRVAGELGLDPVFPDDVEAETAALVAAPGIDDARLVDRTDLPFVTIDGPTSRDLDQALYVARDGDGFVVHYALADAAHFVPPHSALFREALRRGASYYLPGLSIPMLPRALSEGLVSLNPGVPRRALSFVSHVARDGRVRDTRVERVRIVSRKKLAFGEVQALYDRGSDCALAREPYAASLESLRAVGEACMVEATSRDIVRYHRREVELSLSGAEGLSLVIVEGVRDAVERYNEQISLLVNREGARILLESHSPRIQPIYRVHGAPDPEKVAALAALTAGVAGAHGLPVERWVFRGTDPTETLAAYVDRLPRDAETRRVAAAIERQAVLVNVRSAYATEPAAHFGVGAEIYARFSAPMREVVGVYLHKEMMELQDPACAEPPEVDEALRVRVVEAANRGRDIQRRANDLVGRLVLGQLLGPDLAKPVAERPVRLGTVMGLSPSKVHVDLDDPPVDVKLFVRDLGKARGGAWLTMERAGATLRDGTAGVDVLRVGDEVRVRVAGRDDAQDRWILAID